MAKPALVTIVSAMMLLIPAALGLFVTSTPSVICPYPAMTALVVMYTSFRIAAVLVPSMLFLAWNQGLLRGEAKLPRKSYGLLLVAIVLSIVWFVAGWKDGVHYQSAAYVHEVCIINAIWIAIVGSGFVWFARRNSSFTGSLVVNWLLFVWLAWYAFPYLGELP